MIMNLFSGYESSIYVSPPSMVVCLSAADLSSGQLASSSEPFHQQTCYPVSALAIAIPIFHDGIINAPKHEMAGTPKVADAFAQVKPCCSTAVARHSGFSPSQSFRMVSSSPSKTRWPRGRRCPEALLEKAQD
jgi:hypothetical protein